MSKPASTSANLARGYPIAVVAAAFLSTTAIFIRHLTQTYQVPALVLALWRDVFVALTLLPVSGAALPRAAAGEPPAPAVPGSLRPGAVDLQRAMDAVGRPERGGGRHRDGVLLGRVHRPAGPVAAQGTPGLGQAPGGGPQPGGLRPGLRCARPGGLARSTWLAS